MVNAVRNFTQIKMEQFTRHSAIGIEPVLGITPEALYAVYVVCTFRFALYFLDHYVVAADCQRSVCFPVVSIVP